MAANPNPGPLGIIAGRGDLPGRVADAALAQGRDVFVLALKGFAEPASVSAYSHAWVRLADGGSALEYLRDRHVRDLVFAGGISRPSLLSLRPDWRATKFLAKVGWRALGDNSLLSAVAAEFEAEGFRVIGADDVWREGIMPAGQLTSVEPNQACWQDIRRGIAVVEALGAVDVGAWVCGAAGHCVGGGGY